MKILVTAFDPFGGDSENSSLIVLNEMADSIDDIEIKKLIIPTVYNECARIVWEKAKEYDVDAILSLGQAGGRGSVTVEVIGINYAYAKIGDNNGVRITGEKLFDDKEAALFSTLPVKAMAEGAKDRGFNAELSVSAGGFVCNSLLYTLLKKAKDEKSKIRAGFVHLPYEEGQKKDGFSMKGSDMARCVEEMIKIIKNSERI